MITVIDTETTSLKGSACQIGALILDDDFNVTDKKETLLNPLEPISSGASGIHFIRDDMVQDSPLIKDVFKEYMPSEGYLVAHNAEFDIRALVQSLCMDSQEELIPSECVRVLDTLTLARELYRKGNGGVDDHKLGTLYHHFKCHEDMPYSGVSHTALFDCYMCMLVLKAMLKENNLTMDQAYKLCNMEIQDTKCTTKKYKESGKTWEEVFKEDPSYCRWLINNFEFKYINKGAYIKKWLKSNV